MFRAYLDDRQLKKWIKEFPKQVKFAQALTLTKVAQDAQAEIIKEVPNQFTNYGNNRWFDKNRPTGIKVKAANTKTLTSQVFTGKGMHWAARQIQGKSKRSEGSKDLIIPVYKKTGFSIQKKAPRYKGFERPTWRTASGYKKVVETYSSSRVSGLTHSKKYGSYSKRSYPYVTTTKSGVVLIKRGKSQKFEPIFKLQPTAKRPAKKWKFFEQGIRAGRKNVKKHFFESMRRAVATAKSKP